MSEAGTLWSTINYCCVHVEMNISPETKLNNQSACSYKSVAASVELADGSSPSDFTCDLNKNYGESTQVK